jgi:Flp pilus assembly protein TadB
MPASTASATSDPASVRALADYYVQRRLRTQQEYFTSRLRRNESGDRRTRSLPPLLFFASVAAAFAHFGYDLWTHHHGEPMVSILLIVLAAGLAVIGAGLRTYRGAHEFSRNSTRFRAKLVALRHVGERLEHQTEPVAIYRELWYCEQILESEHREWLRLMSDAEWFG